MKLELIDSLSLPGNPGKANDDAFGYREHAAVVLDGATGLGENLLPGPSDAAWLARFKGVASVAHDDLVERTLDALAAHLAAHLDLDRLLSLAR